MTKRRQPSSRFRYGKRRYKRGRSRYKPRRRKRFGRAKHAALVYAAKRLQRRWRKNRRTMRRKFVRTRGKLVPKAGLSYKCFHRHRLHGIFVVQKMDTHLDFNPTDPTWTNGFTFFDVNKSNRQDLKYSAAPFTNDDTVASGGSEPEKCAIDRSGVAYSQLFPQLKMFYGTAQYTAWYREFRVVKLVLRLKEHYRTSGEIASTQHYIYTINDTPDYNAFAPTAVNDVEGSTTAIRNLVQYPIHGRLQWKFWQDRDSGKGGGDSGNMLDPSATHRLSWHQLKACRPTGRTWLGGTVSYKWTPNTLRSSTNTSNAIDDTHVDDTIVDDATGLVKYPEYKKWRSTRTNMDDYLFGCNFALRFPGLEDSSSTYQTASSTSGAFGGATAFRKYFDAELVAYVEYRRPRTMELLMGDYSQPSNPYQEHEDQSWGTTEATRVTGTAEATQ